MSSRMEKYHNNLNSAPRRTEIKKRLYEEIYDDVEYTNVEGIATLESTGEIDLSKIKALIQERSNDNRIFKEPTFSLNKQEKNEEKNYDVLEILNKAKTEKESDDKTRSLRNTNYDILKNLNLKTRPIENEQDQLKDLINTITKTNALNQLNDGELSLDLLEDLKSGDKTLTNNELINKIVEEVKNDKKIISESEMDTSFYTSGYNFKPEDFEDLKDIQVSLKKNSILMKLTIVLVSLVVIGFIIYKIIM